MVSRLWSGFIIKYTINAPIPEHGRLVRVVIAGKETSLTMEYGSLNADPGLVKLVGCINARLPEGFWMK